MTNRTAGLNLRLRIVQSEAKVPTIYQKMSFRRKLKLGILKNTIFPLWPKMKIEMKLDTFLDKKKIVHNFAAFS